MNEYAVFRTNCRGVGGLVDFCGTVIAYGIDEAEEVARLMFSVDRSLGEELDIYLEGEE